MKTPPTADRIATYTAFEQAKDRPERMRLALIIIEQNLEFLLGDLKRHRIESNPEREAYSRQVGLALRELGGLVLDSLIPGEGDANWKLFRNGDVALPLKPEEVPPLGLEPDYPD